MARTVTTQEIKPPVRQGETCVIDFTNPTGSDPSAWSLEVYLSNAVTGEPIALTDTTAVALDDADNTIRVTIGEDDTAALTAGEIYGELWREGTGVVSPLRAFKFEVADPIRETGYVPGVVSGLSYGVQSQEGDYLTIASLAASELQITVYHWEDDGVTAKDLTGYTYIALEICEGTPTAFGDVLYRWDQTEEIWGVITVTEVTGVAVLTITDLLDLTPGTYAFRWLLSDSDGVQRLLYGVWTHTATGI